MMNYFILNLVSLLFLMTNDMLVIGRSRVENNNMEIKNSKMRIKIGSKIFIATLDDNATATAFIAQLPMTINMIELNGNEKFYRLKNSLPINSVNPKTIRNGDIMIYGNNTLVLFYKTFPTSYSYTKIGQIDDTNHWAETLGDSDITITFEE